MRTKPRHRKARPPELDRPFPERVLFLRERKDLTQEQVASACDIGKASVCHWEKGTRLPSQDKLPTLARLFDVPMLDLVRGVEAWALLEQALEAAA